MFGNENGKEGCLKARRKKRIELIYCIVDFKELVLAWWCRITSFRIKLTQLKN